MVAYVMYLPRIQTTMKTFHIILAFSTLSLVSSFDWNDLRAKWVPTATPDVDSFYKIPRTVSDAVDQGWVSVKGINNLKVTAYCLPNDVHYCILLDRHGYIAGVQIGILVNDVKKIQRSYNMSRIDMFRKKRFFHKDVWTCTFYTVDPKIIQRGGRSEWKNLTGTDGAWLETKNGYLPIARYTKDLDPIWTRATCLAQMGTHFYYNSSKTQDCSTLRPLFVTYNKEELHSVGWFVLGSPTIKGRPWMEKMPEQIIELINPTGPPCLYEGVQKYGIPSIHTYFISQPWKTECPIIGAGVRDQITKDRPEPRKS